MKYIFAFIFLLVSSFNLHAQVDLEAYENILNTERSEKIFSEKEAGSFVAEKTDSVVLYKVITKVLLDKQYKLSTKIPLKKKSVRKGQKILISFDAKTLDASLETLEAKLAFQLKYSDSSKDRVKNVLSIGQQWKTYYIPVEIDKYVPKDELSLAIHYGFPPQEVVMKHLNVQIIPADISVEDLPKTLNIYKGMEANAEWRKEAFDRIDKIRSGDITIKVTQNGKPVENAGVEFNLIKPEFDWGVAFRVNQLRNNSEEMDRLSKAFNLMVVENDLKLKFWDRKNSRKDVIENLTDIRKKGVALKGHVLMWPGFSHMPANFKEYENEPNQLVEILNDHIDDVLKSTAGLVDRWDVVNEAYTNTDVQRLTGSEEALYDVFRKVKTEYPGIKTYVNEYGIINRGGMNAIKQEWYYNYIKRIDENTDGAVDGIGIQSHIGTDLTPPEKVYEIIDYYSKLGKTISISEFTMDIKDPIIRKLYTEDFIIAAYSHPAVNEFLFWGYKGDNNSKVDIFNKDKSLGSMGKAFYGLVHGLWNTSVSDVSDKNGEIKARGTYGTYEFHYKINGEIRTGKFMHFSGQETVVNIELP